MIRFLTILLLSSAVLIAAQKTENKVKFIGQSTGIFEKPRGEKDLNVTGSSTADFSWGKITRGSPGRNSLKFEGEGFFASLDEKFKIGSITYYNGTTATGTNASMVNLKISLAFDDGSSSSFSIPIKFISTPNTGSHKENADLVKIENKGYDKLIRVENKPYSVNLQFGEDATEFGFSNQHSNEFGVFEGFNATIDLNAIIVPYTAPPPPAEVQETARAIPIQQGYAFSSRKKTSTSDKNKTPALPKKIQSSAVAKPAAIAPKANTSTNTTAPAIISLPPSRLKTPDLPPPHPGSGNSFPSIKVPEKPSTVAHPNTSKESPARIAKPPAKIEKSSGKLAHTPTSIAPPPRNNTFKTSASSRGQITYLDPLAYNVFRSVGVKIPTEHGLTYSIQTTSDGASWDDFSSPIVGDGSEKVIHKEINESKIREYRIKVTQTK